MQGGMETGVGGVYYDESSRGSSVSMYEEDAAMCRRARCGLVGVSDTRQHSTALQLSKSVAEGCESLQVGHGAFRLAK